MTELRNLALICIASAAWVLIAMAMGGLADATV